MKTIGMIGGMSWESSLEYYRIINEEVKRELGSLHSAKNVMVSVDFGEIEQLQHAGEWDRLGRLMAEAANKVEAAGADMVLLCTNTMHRHTDEIEASVKIPFLHIADAVGAEMQKRGMGSAGLLGTKFTMESDFYKERLKARFGIETNIPDEDDRELVHRIIYGELVRGMIKPESREALLSVIERLAEQGADGVILGCTELPLLVQQIHTSVPVLDSTYLHARTAVEKSL
ncbi:aspartate/glutamate racemase family protein [Bacillus marinisedimentorum]|uniref:aspartate/glutamate racemase family protein n=1 Tax=Bacillus marinisedimentorum TaxID=1821260 RepID=UPI0007E162A2|nr:aspartate/glutamate racemase family protein [Bacillus marinisedimentorum]